MDHYYNHKDEYHWFGYAKDAHDVNHAFKVAMFVLFLIIIVIPVLLALPVLVTLLSLIWLFRT